MSFPVLLKLSILWAVVLTSAVKITSKDASSDQYDFLVELYESTSGEMWKNNSNWLISDNETSICNWKGITCAGKWVQKLDLHSNGLGGPLPDKWERLPYLESIDLSSNKFVMYLAL